MKIIRHTCCEYVKSVRIEEHIANPLFIILMEFENFMFSQFMLVRYVHGDMCRNNNELEYRRKVIEKCFFWFHKLYDKALQSAPQHGWVFRQIVLLTHCYTIICINWKNVFGYLFIFSHIENDMLFITCLHSIWKKCSIEKGRAYSLKWASVLISSSIIWKSL